MVKHIRHPWVQSLQQQPAIAVIRAESFQTGCSMAQAVAAGGLQHIEITWNSDQAALLIEELRLRLPHCQIGAGTLLTVNDVETAIAAGAQFLFSPHTESKLIETAVAQSVPVIPGALSPTEIVTAWQAGATCVKVFPVQSLGGAAYIRNLQGPLGHIPLIPTGGVTFENMIDLLHAGAIAVGLSSSLFPKTAIQQQDWPQITQRAEMLVRRLQPFTSTTSCLS